MENSRKWLENLNDDDLLFIKQIVLHSGSLKEVANYYGVTYPTLRNKLNSLIQKIEFFENGDYKFITNLINERMDKLKECKDFNKKYEKLYDLIDEIELLFDDKQKSKFNEVIQLFYEVEEYYFALAYSLGLKYGNDLKNL